MPYADGTKDWLEASLVEMGLTVREMDDGALHFVDRGVGSVVTLHPDRTVSLACSVRDDRLVPDPVKVNAANLRTRFLRFSTRRRLLVLAADFVTEEDPDARFRWLGNVLGSWRSGIDELRSLVAEHVPA